MGRRRRTVPVQSGARSAHAVAAAAFPAQLRRMTDAHHIVHWSSGGETSKDNLVLLCRHHHRLVHEGGFSLEPGPGGDLVFRDPRGRGLEPRPRRHHRPRSDIRLPRICSPPPTWRGTGSRWTSASASTPCSRRRRQVLPAGEGRRQQTTAPALAPIPRRRAISDAQAPGSPRRARDGCRRTSYVRQEDESTCLWRLVLAARLRGLLKFAVAGAGLLARRCEVRERLAHHQNFAKPPLFPTEIPHKVGCCNAILGIDSQRCCQASWPTGESSGWVLPAGSPRSSCGHQAWPPRLAAQSTRCGSVSRTYHALKFRGSSELTGPHRGRQTRHVLAPPGCIYAFSSPSSPPGAHQLPDVDQDGAKHKTPRLTA